MLRRYEATVYERITNRSRVFAEHEFVSRENALKWIAGYFDNTTVHEAEIVIYEGKRHIGTERFDGEKWTYAKGKLFA